MPTNESLGERLNTILKKNFLSRLFYAFGGQEAEESDIASHIEQEIKKQEENISTAEQQFREEMNRTNAIQELKVISVRDAVRGAFTFIGPDEKTEAKQSLLVILPRYLTTKDVTEKDDLRKKINDTLSLSVLSTSTSAKPIREEFNKLNNAYALAEKEHQNIKKTLLRQVNEYIDNKSNKNTSKQRVMASLKGYLEGDNDWENVKIAMQGNSGWDSKILYSQVENTVDKVRELKDQFGALKNKFLEQKKLSTEPKKLNLETVNIIKEELESIRNDINKSLLDKNYKKELSSKIDEFKEGLSNGNNTIESKPLVDKITNYKNILIQGKGDVLNISRLTTLQINILKSVNSINGIINSQKNDNQTKNNNNRR